MTYLGNIYVRHVSHSCLTQIFPLAITLHPWSQTQWNVGVSDLSNFGSATERCSFEARMIIRHQTLEPSGPNVDFNYCISFEPQCAQVILLLCFKFHFNVTLHVHQLLLNHRGRGRSLETSGFFIQCSFLMHILQKNYLKSLEDLDFTLSFNILTFF